MKHQFRKVRNLLIAYREGVPMKAHDVAMALQMLDMLSDHTEYQRQLLRRKDYEIGILKGEAPNDEYASIAEDLARCLSFIYKTVLDYGKPGGPWNVPDEPGAWIFEARQLLERYDIDTTGEP